MKRFRMLNVLLLALVALAAWRTIDVWRRQPPKLAPTDEGRAQPAEPLPPLGKKPPLPQMVNSIAEQDLFDISRQEAKPGEEAPTPMSTPAPPPTLKLAGVVSVGVGPEALVTDTSQGNKQIRLQVGEDISGYSVDQIILDDPPSISLKASSGDTVTLTLAVDLAKQGGGAAFGPGGRPTPRAAVPRGPVGASVASTAQASGGSFAPNDARAELERRREDARKRAERARERLKRLRAEAANR
jgi:hypothetical protein